MKKLGPLETLARDLVGDGKSPNLYFVSNGHGVVLAVFAKKDAAVMFAENEGAYLAEDRRIGTFWESRQFQRDQTRED